MNSIIAWDQSLFRTINTGMASPFLDQVMPLFRYPSNWIPFYVFFAVFLVLNFKQKGLYAILLGAFAILVSDQFSSHLLKPLVHRLRPCNDMNLAGSVRLVIDHCGAGFSFPSSHAANHFTFALFIITMLPTEIKWARPLLLIWAGLVSFAQVYVGIHYPIDVITGAIIGCFIGWATATIGKGIFHVELIQELKDIEE
jgi:membrane-associated phospholipid phosphatase